jgi:hypothetical protein
LGHRLVFAEIAETNLPLIGNPGYSDFGSALAEVRREIDTFGYFDLMAGSKPCCLNIGF